MFEKATAFQPLEQIPLFDVGSLAEALFYYDKVYVVGHSRAIAQLVFDVGFSETLSLCESGNLHIRLLIGNGYFSERDRGSIIRCIYSRSISPDTPGAHIDFILSQRKADGDLPSKGEKLILQKICALMDCVNDDYIEIGGLHPCVALLEKANQADFGKWLAELFISSVYPEHFPKGKIVFQVSPVEVGEADVSCNLDFNTMLRTWRAAPTVLSGGIVLMRPAPTASTILNLGVLALVQTTFALRENGDFAMSPTADTIASTLIDEPAKRATKMIDIQLFQEHVLNDTHAIANAIVTGQRTFKDLIKLIHKRKSFQKWLSSLNNDEKLLSAYIKEISNETWVEKLPTRVTRFCTFTGAGILADLFITGGWGTATGVTVGAFDAFVLDRLLAGPPLSKFINGPLATFAGKS